MRAYLRRHGVQEADAADVTQDTLQKVASAIHRLEYDREKGRFRGWLLTITRHSLIKHLTRASRAVRGTGDTGVQQLLDARGGCGDGAGEDDSRLWDRECQRQLVDVAMESVRCEFEMRSWRAFYASIVEERPVSDVADELGMSVGAVYVARSRVTARLRRTVAELEADL
jgi:RNA polymerase sigma-70 factor (ECF subfamily)